MVVTLCGTCQPSFLMTQSYTTGFACLNADNDGHTKILARQKGKRVGSLTLLAPYKTNVYTSHGTVYMKTFSKAASLYSHIYSVLSLCLAATRLADFHVFTTDHVLTFHDWRKQSPTDRDRLLAFSHFFIDQSRCLLRNKFIMHKAYWKYYLF